MNYLKGLSGISKVREDLYYISDHRFFDYDTAMERGYSSQKAMEEDFIIKWNRKVQPRDIVFYLGNFSVGNQKEVKEILKNLNGRINLIVGTDDTHDNILSCKQELASVYYKLDIFINNIPVTMNHHPQRVWNRMDHGAWHLHGNVRYEYFSAPDERIFDVSVDGISEGEPYSFDDIYNIMGEKDKYRAHLEKSEPIKL